MKLSRVVSAVLAMAFALLLSSQARATLADDLTGLSSDVQTDLSAGGLSKNQTHVLEKILKKVQKEQGVPADDPARQLAVTAQIVKRVEKATEKGVDLSSWRDTLLSTMKSTVTSLHDSAVRDASLLAVQRDSKKVEKIIAAGDAKVDASANAPNVAKEAARLAKAAARYALASAKAGKKIEKEKAKGLYGLTASVSFPGGGTTLSTGAPLILDMSLPVDPKAVQSGTIYVTKRDGSSPTGGVLQVSPGGDGTTLYFTVQPPLQPGSYTIKILGADQTAAPALASTQGLFLQTTVSQDFDVGP